MSFIWTIIAGVVVGVIAKFLMPGDNEPKGFVLTAILGIVGAIVGGLIPLFGDAGLMWWIKSIIGAIIVLIVYQMTIGRKA